MSLLLNTISHINTLAWGSLQYVIPTFSPLSLKCCLIFLQNTSLSESFKIESAYRLDKYLTIISEKYFFPESHIVKLASKISLLGLSTCCSMALSRSIQNISCINNSPLEIALLIFKSYLTSQCHDIIQSSFFIEKNNVCLDKDFIFSALCLNFSNSCILSSKTAMISESFLIKTSVFLTSFVVHMIYLSPNIFKEFNDRFIFTLKGYPYFDFLLETPTTIRLFKKISLWNLFKNDTLQLYLKNSNLIISFPENMISPCIFNDERQQHIYTLYNNFTERRGIQSPSQIRDRIWHSFIDSYLSSLENAPQITTRTPYYTWSLTQSSTLGSIVKQLENDIKPNVTFSSFPSNLKNINLYSFINDLKSYYLDIGHSTNMLPSFSLRDDIASDAGGVRRQIMTDFFNELFSQKQDLFFQDFNGNNLLLGYLPTIDTSLSETQIKESVETMYTLGILLGVCWESSQGRSQYGFTVGQHLSPVFFKCLSCFSVQDLLLLKKTYFSLNNLNQTLLIRLYGCLLNDDLGKALFNFTYNSDSSNLSLLSIFVEENEAQEEQTITIHNLYKAAFNRLSTPQGNFYLKLIRGIIFVTLGMNKIILDSKWNSLQKEESLVVYHKIQGNLNSDTILNALFLDSQQSYEISSTSVVDFFLKLVINLPKTRYDQLREWVKKASKDELKLFLKSVTGNESISHHARIKVSCHSISSNLEDQYPRTATCFNTISLPLFKYQTGEDFALRMQVLLNMAEQSFFGRS